MYRIDITGVPGVGKSTLLNWMKKNRDKKSKWLTDSEAILKTFFKSDLTKIRKLKYILNANPKYIKKIFIEKHLDEEFNSEVLDEYYFLVEDKLNSRIKKSNYPDSSKIKHVDFYQNKLKSVFLINNYCNNAVIFDESVTHHTNIDSFKKTYKKFGGDNFLFPDMILHVKAPLELVVERLIDRKKKGRTRLLHGGKTIDELREMSKKRLNSIDKKVDKLCTMNIKCLTVSYINNDENIYNKIIENVK